MFRDGLHLGFFGWVSGQNPKERRQVKKAAHNCLILLFLLTAPGCVSSTYNNMLSEREDPFHRGLLDARDALETQSYVYSTHLADQPAINIVLRAVGDADATRLVILIHGVGNDSSAWRFPLANLAADHRLLLVDLPGCGESDAPDPQELASDGYSPTAMAHRVAQALQAHLTDHELPSEITLVGHSLGGAVVPRMMGCDELRHRYSALDRVDRLILLSPLDAEFINEE